MRLRVQHVSSLSLGTRGQEHRRSADGQCAGRDGIIGGIAPLLIRCLFFLDRPEGPATLGATAAHSAFIASAHRDAHKATDPEASVSSQPRAVRVRQCSRQREPAEWQNYLFERGTRG